MFFFHKMKSISPFLTLNLLLVSLASAAPTPPTRSEIEVMVEGMRIAETGKSWTVYATEKGIKEGAEDGLGAVNKILINSPEFLSSSEVIMSRIEEWLRVVIHLFQSETQSHKGVGAVFSVTGSFPIPDRDYVGKVTEKDKEYPIIGESKLETKSALVQQVFCPKSDRICKDGASWTARQTELDEKTHLPVVDSPILLETQVVFQNSGDCESFIAEWNEVCDSWRQVLPVATYLLESDFRNSFAQHNEVWRYGVTRANSHEGLVSLIALVQGLKETAPLELIVAIAPDTSALFGQLDEWRQAERGMNR
jgi:hypothetical protein